MHIIIPLRVLMLIIGGIVGYTTGFFIELQYDTHADYYKTVSVLTSKLKHVVYWEDDVQSDEQPGYISDSAEHICFDCCDSSTEESEGN